MQTIFPILRYRDARYAIQWLCTAFGFVEVFSVPPAGSSIRHAQLRLGTNIIMLGSVRSAEAMNTPIALHGATQALSVYVENVDAHFQRATGAGASITKPPHDTDFGSREYYATDPEGHPWIFSSYLPADPSVIS